MQHPLNSKCTNQAVEKGEPSLGSGSPSRPAVSLLHTKQDFDQLPRESPKAFAAFRIYLDMGPQRSLSGVASRLGKSKTLMERWSKRHRWCDRVAAHAGHVAEVERVAIEHLGREKAIEWHQFHEQQRQSEWEMHSRLVRLAERVIERWERNENRMGTLEGIARLLELASKLGRLASGMETGGSDGAGKDDPAVRVEVTLALEKIYGEPLPGEVVDVEPVGEPRRLPEKVP